MVIRILDHVSTYSTYGDGEVIFRLIADELRSKRPVSVSFDGISSVSSAFVNSALVRLIEQFEFDFIRDHLDILDSTRQINRLIRDRFLFAIQVEKAQSAPELASPSN